MAKLTAKTRNALPAKDFALPGRKYPIPDKGHAKAALSRAAHNATPAEDAKIKREVKAKFPGMEVEGTKKPAAKKEMGRPMKKAMAAKPKRGLMATRGPVMKGTKKQQTHKAIGSQRGTKARI